MFPLSVLVQWCIWVSEFISPYEKIIQLLVYMLQFIYIMFCRLFCSHDCLTHSIRSGYHGGPTGCPQDPIYKRSRYQCGHQKQTPTLIPPLTPDSTIQAPTCSTVLPSPIIVKSCYFVWSTHLHHADFFYRPILFTSLVNIRHCCSIALSSKLN